jgi:hypothetical protein
MFRTLLSVERLHFVSLFTLLKFTSGIASSCVNYSAFQHLCQPLLDILCVVEIQHIDVCVFADMTLLYFYLVSLSRPVLISG